MHCWASAVKTNCTRETKLFLETRALCIIKIHLVVGDIGVPYALISVYLRWFSLSVCQLYWPIGIQHALCVSWIDQKENSMHFEQYLNQGWFIKSRGELPKLGVMCPETEAQLIPINWTWTGVGEMRPFSWSLKLPFLSAERFTQVRQHKGARTLENTPLCF